VLGGFLGCRLLIKLGLQTQGLGRFQGRSHPTHLISRGNILLQVHVLLLLLLLLQMYMLLLLLLLHLLLLLVGLTVMF
jgi:hypothetical protein